MSFMPKGLRCFRNRKRIGNAVKIRSSTHYCNSDKAFLEKSATGPWPGRIKAEDDEKSGDLP